MMLSESFSTSSQPASPPTKPRTSSASAMLTPSEMLSLRNSANEAMDLVRTQLRKRGQIRDNSTA